MDKELYNITFFSQTISNTTRVTGKTVCLMALVKHIITMVIFIRDISLTDKEKATAHMSSIKSTDMKANGKITHFLLRESYLETGNCSSKGNLTMD